MNTFIARAVFAGVMSLSPFAFAADPVVSDVPPVSSSRATTHSLSTTGYSNDLSLLTASLGQSIRSNPGSLTFVAKPAGANAELRRVDVIKRDDVGNFRFDARLAPSNSSVRGEPASLPKFNESYRFWFQKMD